MLNVKMGEVKLKAQLDSWSGLTVISEKTFNELFDKNYVLRKVVQNVNRYTGKKINVLRFFKANLSFNDKNVEFVELYVIENGGPNLLGRDFIKKLILS